ncbi:3-dehydroquinate synthase [Hymenobacter busanensis]|uniref:3-dehydroquinate synthase n=1 Tax=Hymenobacter busanensis TaxID=2607656 RepID=A0A7L5A0Q4_9BACT|nr:3-dehydroquinate synthase [Hymenobacter busanensis]KAA9332353.1 3-dehydroquinate synthase [Hymenobacter busanensis]QHJ07310.1 3-dehydroquinate synthase [Hymenobacter busanensis]
MNNSSLYIGPTALPALAALLARPGTTRVAVLADTNTVRLCYPKLQPHLPADHLLIEMSAGEEHKTLATCERVWAELTEHQFDRHSVLVCLGGGVVTDLGGFCAALYKRGLRCVVVPTTLLAQVDAGIGGKTGVDFQGYKNHLGVFQLPEAVCIEPEFLATLDPRELRAGYAEVVKHWLIADSDAFVQGRQQGMFVEDWALVVQASVAIKQAIVAQDPLERGPRKLLNFGHTVGHALESYLLGQAGRAVLHGEAVAAGMVCEAWLSVQKGLLTERELDQIETFLFSVFEKVQFVTLETDAIAELARQDKKNQGATINCTLLEGIGRGVYDQPVTVAELAESLRYYHRL